MTQNQLLFKKQIARIKRLIRKLEKQGEGFMKFPLPEIPKRVTQKKLELLSTIKTKTLKSYAEYVQTVETPKPLDIYRKREKKLDLYIPNPRHKNPDEYVRKGRSSYERTEAQIEAARKNLEKARQARKGKPLTEAQREAIKRNLEKAREARKGKPPTEKQREAWKKNLEKARQARKGKPATEKQKEAGRRNLEKAREKRRVKKIARETGLPEWFVENPPEGEDFSHPSEPEFPRQEDIILDLLIETLDKTFTFRGLAEYVKMEIDHIVAIDGKKTVVNRLVHASSLVLDRAEKLAGYTYKYKDQAIEVTLFLLELISGNNLSFDSMIDVYERADADVEMASGYTRYTETEWGNL